jgi:hypothetical protein
MAISRKPLDIDNYSAAEGGNGSAIPGYYSRVNLNDIINNFIVGYTGDGKVLPKVPRYEVAFWAQRAVQEFSYDIFHAEKNMEIELSSTLQISLPSDYVNYVDISCLDADGNLRPLQNSKRLKSTKSASQDQDYNYIYDQEGNIIYEETSQTLKQFGKNDISTKKQNYESDEYDIRDEVYGAKYGSEPERANANGTYVLDLEAGKIYFDSMFGEGDIIVLSYISDGLGENGDFANVLVPKLAEDAVYASILYNLSKLRTSASGAAGLYKKEAYAKLRNAKIRLSNMKIKEIAQVLRGKSKWIKH